MVSDLSSLANELLEIVFEPYTLWPHYNCVPISSDCYNEEKSGLMHSFNEIQCRCKPEKSYM